VHEFDVDVSACAQLLKFVTDKKYRDELGILKIKDLSFPGFTNYTLHEADHHHSNRQKQYVSVISAAKMQQALEYLPPLQSIVDEACEVLGCTELELQHAHFIVQNNPIAIFSWHNDTQDLRLHRDAVTVIVPLNNAPAAMEIWGFNMHVYEGIGKAIAFPGAARHRSVSLKSVVDSKQDFLDVDTCALQVEPVKVALFFSKDKK